MESCLGCSGVLPERSAAVSLGVSRRMLRSLIADGVLVRVRRGVLVGSCVANRAANDPELDYRIRISALLYAFPDCAASHESAAALHGLPLLDRPHLVTATRQTGAWRGGGATRVRIAPLPASHLTTADEMAVTTLARTAIDIARTSSLRAALITGDAAARRCGMSAIADALDDSAAWTDLGRAERAVALFDARSESPLESVSRAIFIEEGLPMPEPQVVLEPEPGLIYRVDFFWGEQRVVGEADGLSKYQDLKALKMEKVRQELIERMDIQVVRWTWRDMLVDTDRALARLRRALRS